MKPTSSRIETQETLAEISRVLGLSFPPYQRELLLSNVPPNIRWWTRLSGKTTTAILWMFLHVPECVTPKNIQDFCPDPDLKRSPHWGNRVFVYKEAVELAGRLHDAGVEIQCVLIGSDKGKKEIIT